MVDFDTALTILENKARRQILEMLVREPHYPLHLSKHLEISQQAVMKHLKVLEKFIYIEGLSNYQKTQMIWFLKLNLSNY